MMKGINDPPFSFSGRSTLASAVRLIKQKSHLSVCTLSQRGVGFVRHEKYLYRHWVLVVSFCLGSISALRAAILSGRCTVRPSTAEIGRFSRKTRMFDEMKNELCRSFFAFGSNGAVVVDKDRLVDDGIAERPDVVAWRAASFVFCSLSTTEVDACATIFPFRIWLVSPGVGIGPVSCAGAD